jgi:hypothetical protein
MAMVSLMNKPKSVIRRINFVVVFVTAYKQTFCDLIFQMTAIRKSD